MLLKKNKGLALSSSKGFTLIELLVVIAIIGILATIVLVSLNSARVKARDARRNSDMHQIALAMEMYYDSQPSTYPTITSGYNALTSIGTYMNPVAIDPTNTGTQQYYFTNGTAVGDSASNCYCVYVQEESGTSALYVLSNKNGTKKLGTGVTPTTATCCAL